MTETTVLIGLVIFVYCIPLFICNANGGGGSGSVLILILLIANAVLVTTAPAITAYAVAAVMWSAAAIIAAMAVFTNRMASKLGPIINVAARLEKRHAEQAMTD